MNAFFRFPSAARLEYTERSENVVYMMEMKAFVKRDSPIQVALSRDRGVDEICQHRVCVMLGDGWSKSSYAKHGIEYLKGNDTLN